MSVEVCIFLSALLSEEFFLQPLAFTSTEVMYGWLCNQVLSHSSLFAPFSTD